MHAASYLDGTTRTASCYSSCRYNIMHGYLYNHEKLLCMLDCSVFTCSQAMCCTFTLARILQQHKKLAMRTKEMKGCMHGASCQWQLLVANVLPFRNSDSHCFNSTLITCSSYNLSVSKTFYVASSYYIILLEYDCARQKRKKHAMKIHCDEVATINKQ